MPGMRRIGRWIMLGVILAFPAALPLEGWAQGFGPYWRSSWPGTSRWFQPAAPDGPRAPEGETFGHDPDYAKTIEMEIPELLKNGDWESAVSIVETFGRYVPTRKGMSAWDLQSGPVWQADWNHRVHARKSLLDLESKLGTPGVDDTAARREIAGRVIIDIDWWILAHLDPRLEDSRNTNGLARSFSYGNGRLAEPAQYEWWFRGAAGSTEPAHGWNEHPMTPEGGLRFLQVPATLDQAGSRGEQALFLLSDIRKRDRWAPHNDAAKAAMYRAQLAVDLLGPHHDSTWQEAQYLYQLDQKAGFYERDEQVPAKPWHTLDDREVRVSTDADSPVFRIPDSENPLELYRQVERDYPDSSLMPAAILGQADWFLSRRQFSRAAAEYKRVADQHPGVEAADVARSKLALLDHGDVMLGATRVQLSGRRPELWYACRNTSSVTFTARRIDAAAFVKDMSQGDQAPDLRHDFQRFLNRYDSHTEGGKHLAKDVIRWTESLPRLEQVEVYKTRAPFDSPGMYLIEATVPGQKAPGFGWDTSPEDARGLVILSGVTTLQIEHPNRRVTWVVDSETGRPMPMQQIHLLNRIVKGKSLKWSAGQTDAEGRFVDNYDEASGPQLLWVTTDRGAAWASLGRPRSGQFSASQDHDRWLAEGITNRPLYRPGDTVHFRFWIRSVGDLAARPASGTEFRVDLHRPGTAYYSFTDRAPIHTVRLKADAHGAVHGSVVLPKEGSLGTYYLVMSQDKRPVFSLDFQVEEYRKPEFEVTATPLADSVSLGSEAIVRVQAKFYFGSPVANGTLRYVVERQPRTPLTARPQEFDWLYGAGYGIERRRYPWLGDSESDSDGWWSPEVGSQQTVTLGDDGTALIRIPTQGDETTTRVTYAVHVQVEDGSHRTAEADAEFLAVRRGIGSRLELDRNWYSPPQEIRVRVALRSAASEPVSRAGTLRLAKVGYRVGRPEFSDVALWDVTTDRSGDAEFRIPPQAAGLYRLTYSSPPDAERGPVATSSVNLWVYGPELNLTGYRLYDIEAIPDRREYAVGDVARVLVISKAARGHLWQSRAMASDRPPTLLDNHASVLEIPITKSDQPWVLFHVALIGGGEYHTTSASLYVPPRTKVLRVELTADRSVYAPDATSRLKVKVTNAEGEPVAAPVTLTAFDKSLLALAPESGAGPKGLWWDLMLAHSNNSPSFNSELDRLHETRGQFVCPEFHAGDSVGWVGSIGGPGAQPSDPNPTAHHNGGMSGSMPREAEVAQERPAPVVSRDEVEAPLWIPALEVDLQGTGAADLKFPQSLTTWKVRAWAVSGDTSVGQAELDLVTTRDLLVRLAMPRSGVVGDSATLSSFVHNRSAGPQEVTAELLFPASYFRPTQAGARLQEGQWTWSAKAAVPAGSEHRFDWPVAIVADGAPLVTARVRSKGDADAFAAPLPVAPRGVWTTVARSGTLRLAANAPTTIEFDLPGDVDPVHTSVQFSLSPSAGTAMLDALPFLADYPYGCVEQTMSRFYPTVLARKALEDLQIDLESLSARKPAARHDPRAMRLRDPEKIDNMVREGLARLYRMQHADGGWGWWERDESSPYLSAYVLLGLHSAATAGVTVDASVAERGANYLLSEVNSPVSADRPHDRAMMAYVLSQPQIRKLVTDEGPTKTAIADLRMGLAKLQPYGKVLLALARQNFGEMDAVREIEAIAATVQRDPVSGSAWLKVEPDRHGWWNHEVETNAWLLRAIVATRPESPLIPALMSGLAERRAHGVYWDSTRDSALAVAALAEALATQKPDAETYAVSISLDGQPVQNLTLSWAETLAGNTVRPLPGRIGPGQHRVLITAPRAASLIYGLEVRCLQTGKDPIGSDRLRLVRRYYRLDRNSPAAPASPHPEGASVSSGDLLEVELRLSNDAELRYLAFEDPLPAGCVVSDLFAGSDGFYGHRESRIGKVTLFRDWLSPGEHILRYRLRAETAGEFHALPAHAFDMYNPATRATSATHALRVAP